MQIIEDRNISYAAGIVEKHPDGNKKRTRKMIPDRTILFSLEKLDASIIHGCDPRADVECNDRFQMKLLESKVSNLTARRLPKAPGYLFR